MTPRYRIQTDGQSKIWNKRQGIHLPIMRIGPNPRLKGHCTSMNFHYYLCTLLHVPQNIMNELPARSFIIDTR